jgi:hypothetical protein
LPSVRVPFDLDFDCPFVTTLFCLDDVAFDFLEALKAVVDWDDGDQDGALEDCDSVEGGGLGFAVFFSIKST